MKRPTTRPGSTRLPSCGSGQRERVTAINTSRRYRCDRSIRREGARKPQLLPKQALRRRLECRLLNEKAPAINWTAGAANSDFSSGGSSGTKTGSCELTPPAGACSSRFAIFSRFWGAAGVEKRNGPRQGRVRAGAATFSRFVSTIPREQWVRLWATLLVPKNGGLQGCEGRLQAQ